MTSSITSPLPVAVVLAAGLGFRLQSVQADRPKGFLELGGAPIIARSVQALRSAGVREFVFVTGWRGEHYRTWTARELPGARCVDNPDFASTGSLRSFALGAAAAPGRDVVIVESDLLYEMRAPAELLAAPSRDTLLASGFTGSGDEVWVHANADGHLAHLTKQVVSGREPVGELVGLTRLAAETVSAVVAAERMLPATAHYEDGLNAVATTRPIDLLRIDGLVWCEIDDAAHLVRAQTLIWPRLAPTTAASR